MKTLIVVDMQNDFIDMALGTKEAVAILPYVKEKIAAFEGKVYYTRDTHGEEYLNTREGKLLPVPHCIKGTTGWELSPYLAGLPMAGILDKPTFGSLALTELLLSLDKEETVGTVELCGLCTDICVISNAMLAKAALPEADVVVDRKACAGVTPESHERALSAMAICQITIL